jgi:hypothetical protein
MPKKQTIKIVSFDWDDTIFANETRWSSIIEKAGKELLKKIPKNLGNFLVVPIEFSGKSYKTTMIEAFGKYWEEGQKIYEQLYINEQLNYCKAFKNASEIILNLLKENPKLKIIIMNILKSLLNFFLKIVV